MRVSCVEHCINASIMEQLNPSQWTPYVMQSRKLKYFGHFIQGAKPIYVDPIRACPDSTKKIEEMMD